MNSTAEAVSGELVIPEHDRTLFRHADADAELKAAQRVAAALKTVLDQGGMTMKIGRSEHVLIDGWQTLGSMLGVSPHVVWSRPLARSDEGADGWEARAEARTVDGRVVGSAEAMVTRDERNWKTADEYALRSMAQTRAMSKALRGPLGFVITLAGRNPTPAEEMPQDGQAAADMPDWAAFIDAGVTVDALTATLEQAGHNRARARQLVGGVSQQMIAELGGIPLCVERLAVWLAAATNEASNDDSDQ